MLSHIYIKNIAIIREIDIDPGEGLNILSGETGTGKSIVIQAVELALGGRSHVSMIAEDADRALVQLVFHLNEQEKQLAGRFMSPEDDSLILTRELSRTRGSLARINGEIVRVTELAEIASRLVDIHGQYDNQFFLDPKRHIAILDNYAADSVEPLKRSLQPLYEQYRDAREALLAFRKNKGEYLRRMDFLRYELEEIRAASPLPGEDTELEERLRLLKNMEKITDALNGSYDILYESRLDQCAGMLESIADLDPAFAALASSAAELSYALQDLQDELRHERDRAVFTPDELDQVMQRLDVLDTLKRKYGGSLDNVLKYKEKCEEELSCSPDSEDAEKQLQERYRAARKEALEQSRRLSEARKAAAGKLEQDMLRELQELNFSNVQFAVDFRDRSDAGGQLKLTADGTDEVQFLFSGNKGASLKPLSDIASGGEISRISLAFKNVSSGSDGITTMIFDEIDTGISGRTASVAGAKLRRIGQTHQILCITHLPQIAAAGQYHFLISKEDDAVRSYTRIRRLEPEERAEEIARLLGGSNITETTLRSAEELIASFE